MDHPVDYITLEQVMSKPTHQLTTDQLVLAYLKFNIMTEFNSIEYKPEYYDKFKEIVNILTKDSPEYLL
jgi:hypothetical protein